jgi:hypothetical protein
MANAMIPHVAAMVICVRTADTAWLSLAQDSMHITAVSTKPLANAEIGG